MAQLGSTIINGDLVVSGALTIEGSVDAVINSALYANADASGNVIKSSYAATISIANSILTLNAKDGSVLSTAQISTADTLQAITANGATTDKAISVTNSAVSTGVSTGALVVTGGVGVGGDLYAARVYGAQWNDYAELRELAIDNNEVIEDGSVVVEKGDETLTLTTKRLELGAKIISDTYGICIGERSLLTRPIALCGRVLAKPYEDRERFNLHIGEAVCAAPGGCVSIMTREEIKEYPDCILGHIVSVPTYSTWGKDKIPVNGRVWIHVK